MSSKMFNKANYLPRTISVYQIVGAYFVDIYYNHLYSEAIKMKNDGKVPTITEGYRHASFAFLSAIDKQSKTMYKVEHYNQLLKGINEYFHTWTHHSTLTLSECIDSIVREFVPDDYYASLDKDQKRNILRTILINVIRAFTKVVVTEYIVSIIDNHEELANIEALKDCLVDLFIAEREAMFHKFIDSHGKDEKIDKKFAEKMRKTILDLNADMTRLKKENDDLINEAKMRKDQMLKLVAKYRRLEQMLNTANDEIRELRTKEQNLNKELTSTKRLIQFQHNIESESDDEEPTIINEIEDYIIQPDISKNKGFSIDIINPRDQASSLLDSNQPANTSQQGNTNQPAKTLLDSSQPAIASQQVISPIQTVSSLNQQVHTSQLAKPSTDSSQLNQQSNQQANANQLNQPVNQPTNQQASSPIQPGLPSMPKSKKQPLKTKIETLANNIIKNAKSVGEKDDNLGKPMNLEDLY